MVQSSYKLLWIVLVSVHFILKNASIYFNIFGNIVLRIPIKKVTELKFSQGTLGTNELYQTSTGKWCKT